MLSVQRNGQRTNLQRTFKSGVGFPIPSRDVPIVHLSRMASAPIRCWIIRDFQTQLYKTCGMQSVVLVAYEGKDGHVKASMCVSLSSCMKLS